MGKLLKEKQTIIICEINWKSKNPASITTYLLNSSDDQDGSEKKLNALQLSNKKTLTPYLL